VLDGAGARRLAERTSRSLALIEALRGTDLWPPIVPAIVLADCLSGDVEQDAPVQALLQTCDIVTELPRSVCERAAWLRTAAGRGPASDGVAVAMAEPGGAVLTSGRRIDVEAMALFADGVFVERI
jgi:hypothetical protein